MMPFKSTTPRRAAGRRPGWALWLALLALPCACWPPALAAEPPRVALVLGGGGARGLAHVGVLQALQDMHIPIRCVAGTSMGALVAGTFASGMPIARLQQLLLAADWDDLFVDAPDFDEQSYRRRDLARRYLPDVALAYTEQGLQLPAGAVSGQKIKLFIKQLAGADRGDVDMGQLAMPLAIVAADIGTGEKVVFRQGDLPTAMRASMSIPGLLSPTVVGGRKLVDGGLVDNVPIAVARALCQADVVIAINVGSPLLKAEEVNSLLSVTAQMVNILTEQNVSQSVATLRAADIYIKPDLGDISATDFKRYAQAMRIGYQAVQAEATRLQALAVPEPAYRQWRAAWAGAKPAPPVVDEVQVQGLKRLDAQAVLRHVQAQQGSPLDAPQLARNLGRVYGDGYFDGVDYSLVSEQGRTLLRVLPTERALGPDAVRLGLSLYADATGKSSFTLRGAFNKTMLNSWGGELLLGAELGARQGLVAQWIQPTDAAQRGFVDAVLATEYSKVQTYSNDIALAEYKLKTTVAELAVGLNLGRVARARLGWRSLDRSAELQVGSTPTPAGFRAQGPMLSVDMDKQDFLNNPTRGVTGAIHYFKPQNHNYSRLETELRVAYPLGDWVVAGRLHGERSVSGQLPFFDAASLGGFLDMTAFAPGQLRGDGVDYRHVRLERSLGAAPLGLRGNLRLGMALEAGRVAVPYQETSHTGWHSSRAIYLVGDTPIGPLSVGVANSPQLGSSTVFFYLGR